MLERILPIYATFGEYMSVPRNGSLSPALIGLPFEEVFLEVTPELIKRYALAVNDENPRYFFDGGVYDRGEIVAPPIFGVVPAMLLFRNAMSNGALPISVERTVHGEQEMNFISEIRPGDELLTNGRIRNIKQRSNGLTVEVEIVTTRGDGTVRVSQIMTLFVRTTESLGSSHFPSKIEKPPLCEVVTKVAADQAIRYAQASFTEGIKPHEDHDSARTLGYRTTFLQGQCTLAFATKAIVDNLADGEPARLRTISVRFSQVVYPSELLTIRVWHADTPGRYIFDTVKEDGTLALSNGVAEIA